MTDLRRPTIYAAVDAVLDTDPAGPRRHRRLLPQTLRTNQSAGDDNVQTIVRRYNDLYSRSSRSSCLHHLLPQQRD